jgi:parvulin-like peptidyl-prolyl cis-trans isomerase-like protein
MVKKIKKKKSSVASTPSKSSPSRKPAVRAKAPPPPAEDDDLGEAGEDFEEDYEDAPAAAEPGIDPDDKYWWTPHAVLGVLILLGVLGFFGFFNRWLGFLAANKGAPESSQKPVPTAPAAPKPATTAPTPAKTITIPPRGTAAPDAVTYGAKHILVQWKGSMRASADITRTKEEALKRAKFVAKKAKESKASKTRDADWSKLVAEFTDDPTTKGKAGDLGTFPPAGFDPKFVEGLTKTAVGDVSDAVESGFGYHIIWRTK